MEHHSHFQEYNFDLMSIYFIYSIKIVCRFTNAKFSPIIIIIVIIYMNKLLGIEEEEEEEEEDSTIPVDLVLIFPALTIKLFFWRNPI